MTILASLLLWVVCLSCHAGLQPVRYGLPLSSAPYRTGMWAVRLITSLMALVLTLRDGTIIGMVEWCMTFSVAGVIVAVCVAGLRRDRP